MRLLQIAVIGGRRIGSVLGKGIVREEQRYILTYSRWRKEVTGAGVVRQGGDAPSPEAAIQGLCVRSLE